MTTISNVYCKVTRSQREKKYQIETAYIVIISLYESILDSISDNISRTKNVFPGWLKAICRRHLGELHSVNILAFLNCISAY